MKKLLFKNFIIFIFCAHHLWMNAQCGPVNLPIYESFQGIITNDQLPPCWAASDLGNACKTYTNNGGFGGSACAAFYSGPAATNYFYTQALSLYTGITYSASVWKRVSPGNTVNWNFGLMLGTSQSTTALTSISAMAVASNTMYTPTSNTFIVSTSGTYYIVVAAISSNSATGEFLIFDDLSVKAPCPYPGNSPTITISSSSPTLCAGQTPPTLTASGAHTYTWGDGSQGPTFTVTPQVTTNFQVTGTNTLSGCTAIGSFTLKVNPSPQVIVISSNPSVCVGQSATLTAGGAPFFSWSTGATSSSIIVKPQTATSYTVTGTNQYGCSATGFVSIGVLPLPVISIHPSSATLCPGSDILISAGGGSAYQWFNVPSASGSLASFTPTASLTYTVSGSDLNSCISFTTGTVTIDECTAINETPKQNRFTIFPNPCHTHLNFGDISPKEIIVIYDLMGRDILKTEITEVTSINVSFLPAGLYTVMVADRILRFVKE